MGEQIRPSRLRSAGPLVGVLLSVGLLTSGCIDDLEQAGLTASDGGELQVLWRPCAGEKLDNVRLLVPKGDETDPKDDEVIWEVVRDEDNTSPARATFGPGGPPAGYRETVPLRAPHTGQDVYLAVKPGGGNPGVVFEFAWGSLSSNWVLADLDRKFTPEAFEEYAVQGCGPNVIPS